MRTLPITVAADADYPLPGLLTLPLSLIHI